MLYARYLPFILLINNISISIDHSPSGVLQSQWKQMMKKIQMNVNEHNMFENPKWLEADQLAVYKRD